MSYLKMNFKKVNELNGSRVAILYPQKGFASNPTLVCVARELQSAGAEVVVFSPDGDDAGTLPGVVHWPFPLWWRWRHGGVVQTLNYWKQWGWAKQHQIRNKGYAGFNLFIGANSEGLIQADYLSRRWKVPLVYFSFEIFFRDEMACRSHRREKELEIEASRRASLVLVQDALRGEILARENGLDPATLVCMPVASGGTARMTQSNWLREQLGISADTIIMLHSGAFANWTFAQELLECTLEWPENMRLVVHRNYSPGKGDKYGAMLTSGRYPRVTVHAKFLTPDEYENMVASADLGLALYKPTPPSRYEQKNLLYMGFSSGKLSMYAKHGLPIISVKQPFYAELIRQYQFGAVVDSFDQVACAIMQIQSDNMKYRKEAMRLFNEKLSFNLHWPELRKRLEGLLGSAVH